MTTIHLGDCLNDCDTCTSNYHEQFEGLTCDTCGDYVPDNLVFAGNGELITNNGYGLMVDDLGRYGYNTGWGGIYVCYTCGHLCDEDIHETALDLMGAI